MTLSIKSVAVRVHLLFIFFTSVLMSGCGTDLPEPEEISCTAFKKGELRGTRTGWEGGCPSGCQYSCGSAVSSDNETVYLLLDISCQQGEAEFEVLAPDKSRLWKRTMQDSSELVCIKEAPPQDGTYQANFLGNCSEGKLKLYVFNKNGANITQPGIP